MSISGTTWNITNLTIGGVNIKNLFEQCNFTFKAPEFGITSPITVNFAGCQIYHRYDTPKFDFVVLDAEEKLLFGKFV